MDNTDYGILYNKINKILGELTPLKADCGLLCGCACCKGDDKTGMRLFPFEETELEVINSSSGTRLAVCKGSCNRDKRPLACRIFPFFPTIDQKGKIYVEADYGGKLLCPLIEHSNELVFDKRFFKAVKKIGKILSKDKACRDFLYQSTDEIDMYRAFLKND